MLLLPALPLAWGLADRNTALNVKKAVDGLRRRGVDGIILGCTEMLLILGEDADAPDLINPAPLLADATARHAIL